MSGDGGSVDDLLRGWEHHRIRYQRVHHGVEELVRSIGSVQLFLLRFLAELLQFGSESFDVGKKGASAGASEDLVETIEEFGPE